MARYQPTDTNPRLLQTERAALLLPGTFEHAIDASVFERLCRSSRTTGALATPSVTNDRALAAQERVRAAWRDPFYIFNASSSALCCSAS